ncbi:MAG TPA: glutamine amidotransferase [Corynebacterium sp.]|nr:glutamine amidotransferase [Corynebacterium sp.]
MADRLSIGLILPDVLGTYGDDGNALVLRQRARWRGLDAEIVRVGYGEVVPADLDVYCIGGGEDSAQTLAAEHLIADRGLARAAWAGRPIFAVCAGLQVLGESFRVDGKVYDGVGLIDATTAAMQSRAVGEVVSHPTGHGLTAELSEPLTGFENHMGASVLGREAQPLGMLRAGTGNMDETTFLDISDGQQQRASEGAVQGSVIATYMHGPALARNPQLADLLLARAMGVALAELSPLADAGVAKLRAERLAAAGR